MKGPMFARTSTSTATQEAKPKFPPGAKSPSVLIAIDKTKQKMTVFIDGQKNYVWPVSTGRPGYSTLSGTYIASL